MAGICFFYEDSDVDVWSGKNLDAWNYAVKAAGDVDSMIVVNRTSQIITTPEGSLKFQVVSELPMLENAIYLACPWENKTNQISLWDYDHSADWYVFGPAKGWKSMQLPPHQSVYIPQAGRGALHAVHIASVVMMHRYGVLS